MSILNKFNLFMVKILLPILLIFITSCESRPKLSAIDSLKEEIEVRRNVDEILNKAAENSRLKTELLAENAPVKIIKSRVTKNIINTPEANITFKNVSNKTVDGIKVRIYCYNNFDEPVKEGAFNTNYQNGITQDRLRPSKSNTTGWTLNGFEITTKVKPVVYEVHFTDGTKWAAE